MICACSALGDVGAEGMSGCRWWVPHFSMQHVKSDGKAECQPDQDILSRIQEPHSRPCCKPMHTAHAYSPYAGSCPVCACCPVALPCVLSILLIYAASVE